MQEIDLFGIKYKVIEVPVVNKEEPRRGQINFLTDEIWIDETMPKDLKEQTLMHELFHAVCDITGNADICDDERATQGISAALYYLIKRNKLFDND